jgi:hypothetical protein
MFGKLGGDTSWYGERVKAEMEVPRWLSDIDQAINGKQNIVWSWRISAALSK